MIEIKKLLMFTNKSSLNIANFLNNYKLNAKTSKSNKKRRKSGRNTMTGAYKMPTNKINIRSQSSFQTHNIRNEDKNIDSADNFVNITIPSQHQHQINNVIYNLSEIDGLKTSELMNKSDFIPFLHSKTKLKRSVERRKRPTKVYYKGTSTTQAYQNDYVKKSSNRNDVISTSSNSRRVIKQSQSNAFGKKRKSEINDKIDSKIIDNLLIDLKEKFESLETDESEENLMSSQYVHEPKFEHKLSILSNSFSGFITEFPKFSVYLSYVREQYALISKEQSQFEANKIENLRQNMSKMRSQLDSESLQRTKLSQKLQNFEGKFLVNKILKNFSENINSWKRTWVREESKGWNMDQTMSYFKIS